MLYQLKESALERLLVIKQISSRSINQRSGSLTLGITGRQIRCIIHRYRHEGTKMVSQT